MPVADEFIYDSDLHTHSSTTSTLAEAFIESISSNRLKKKQKLHIVNM